MAGSGQGLPDTSGEPAVLAYSVADRAAILLGLPALGLLLGLLLPVLARWALDLRTALPVRPVFRLVGAVDEPWEIAVALAVGLLLGAGVAVLAFTESMTVTLTGAQARFATHDRIRTVPRADVDAVFVDGRRLVVLDRESRQLVRDTHQASAAVLAGAFRAYGYPWRDADPYADLFRRWVPGTPDLPAATNAVLAAREVALKKKAGRDVDDLRDAVEKLGVTVRDEGARQFWRPLVRS